MDKNDYCQKTNAYMVDFIKFGDAKAGSILTLAGLIGGGVASKAEPIFTSAYKLCPIAGVFVGLNVLVILFFMIKVAIASLDALKPRVPVTEGQSLNSFPDIAKMNEKDFRDAVNAMSDTKIADNYATHNWTLSKLTLDKFTDIGNAVVNLKYVIFSATAFLLCSIAVKIASSL